MKRTEKEQFLRTYCMENLAEAYAGEKMQAVLNWHEGRQARLAGVHAMRNVVFSECLDLCTITFTTKKSKADFFKALFSLYEN